MKARILEYFMEFDLPEPLMSIEIFKIISVLFWVATKWATFYLFSLSIFSYY